MSRRFGILAAVVMSLSATQARASLDLDNPFTLSSTGVVGIRSILQGDGEGENPSNRLTYAQKILDLALGETFNELEPDVNGQGYEYQANPLVDYAGTILGESPTVTTFTVSGDQIVIPSGYDYVLVKYDGKNAGYVLFATDGAAAKLPQFPYSIWGKNDTQYAISGWTGYNVEDTTPTGGTDEVVPEPISIAVWSLLAAAGLGLVRFRRLRA